MRFYFKRSTPEKLRYTENHTTRSRPLAIPITATTSTVTTAIMVVKHMTVTKVVIITTQSSRCDNNHEMLTYIGMYNHSHYSAYNHHDMTTVRDGTSLVAFIRISRVSECNYSYTITHTHEQYMLT